MCYSENLLLIAIIGFWVLCWLLDIMQPRLTGLCSGTKFSTHRLRISSESHYRNQDLFSIKSGAIQGSCDVLQILIKSPDGSIGMRPRPEYS